MRRELDGWRFSHNRGADGGVDSEECVLVSGPVVARSRDGALELGRRYWREVERASHGVLRLRPVGDETGLRLLWVAPVLL